MSVSRKTVIQVWTHAISNRTVTHFENRFGLGDLLRGSIGLLQYCEKNDYECIIDTSLHPISQLLQSKKHMYSDLIEENKNNIQGIFSDHMYTSDNICAYMDNELLNKDIIFFFSNFALDVFATPPSQKVIDAINNLLAPTPLFKEYQEKMLLTLPFSDFSVIHIRLGDDDLITESGTADYQQILFKRILDNNETNHVLLSTSKKFKDFVKTITPIFMYDEPVAHLGFHTEIDKIQHTLFEFLLLCKAKKIYSYSIYNWTSGFAKLASYLNNIELIN
jgi:hypothetical protein